MMKFKKIKEERATMRHHTIQNKICCLVFKGLSGFERIPKSKSPRASLRVVRKLAKKGLINWYSGPAFLAMTSNTKENMKTKMKKKTIKTTKSLITFAIMVTM